MFLHTKPMDTSTFKQDGMQMFKYQLQKLITGLNFKRA